MTSCVDQGEDLDCIVQDNISYVNEESNASFEQLYMEKQWDLLLDCKYC